MFQELSNEDEIPMYELESMKGGTWQDVRSFGRSLRRGEIGDAVRQFGDAFYDVVIQGETQFGSWHFWR